MPMYDYHCGNCDEEFEELVFSSTVPDEEIECPACHEFQATKLLSAPGIAIGSSGSGSFSSSGCQGSGGFT